MTTQLPLTTTFTVTHTTCTDQLCVSSPEFCAVRQTQLNELGGIFRRTMGLVTPYNRVQVQGEIRSELWTTPVSSCQAHPCVLLLFEWYYLRGSDEVFETFCQSLSKLGGRQKCGGGDGGGGWVRNEMRKDNVSLRSSTGEYRGIHLGTAGHLLGRSVHPSSFVNFKSAGLALFPLCFLF